MEVLYPTIPITRRKFSPEEDQALRALVTRYGWNNWQQIASCMPGRDTRQCKERWFHYLSPAVLQSPWTKCEDALLEEKVSQHGHQWKMFELFFPGRVDINIKNRYNVLLRQKRREMKNAMQSNSKSLNKSSDGDPGVEPIVSDTDTLWNDEEFDWISVFDQ
jgi:hypothetical protein